MTVTLPSDAPYTLPSLSEILIEPPLLLSTVMVLVTAGSSLVVNTALTSCFAANGPKLYVLLPLAANV